MSNRSIVLGTRRINAMVASTGRSLGDFRQNRRTVTDGAKQPLALALIVFSDLRRLGREHPTPLHVVLSKPFGAWRFHIHRSVARRTKHEWDDQLRLRARERSDIVTIPAHILDELHLLLFHGATNHTGEIITQNAIIVRVVYRAEKSGLSRMRIRDTNEYEAGVDLKDLRGNLNEVLIETLHRFVLVEQYGNLIHSAYDEILRFVLVYLVSLGATIKHVDPPDENSAQQ